MAVRELENIESGQELEPLTIRDDTRKQQCCFLGTLLAFAYYELPVFEVGLFLPRS